MKKKNNWIWMSHPDWSKGRPIPVHITVDKEGVWYAPFSGRENLELDWKKRGKDWKIEKCSTKLANLLGVKKPKTKGKKSKSKIELKHMLRVQSVALKSFDAFKCSVDSIHEQQDHGWVWLLDSSKADSTPFPAHVTFEENKMWFTVWGNDLPKAWSKRDPNLRLVYATDTVHQRLEIDDQLAACSPVEGDTK